MGEVGDGVRHSCRPVLGFHSFRKGTSRGTYYSLCTGVFGCSSLSSCVLPNVQITPSASFSSMFENCVFLLSIKFPNYASNSEAGVPYMFKNCSSLTNLDLSGLSLQTVASEGMFQGCSGLESLDISQLTTGLGSSFPLMFDGTIKLKKIVLSENFSFYGHYEIERCYLPTPSSLYITGADGRWYVTQSTSYSPEEVPNRTAATYYAVKANAPADALPAPADTLSVPAKALPAPTDGLSAPLDALPSPLHSNSETTPSDAALPPKNQALDSLVLSSTSQPDALPKSDKSPGVPTG